MDAIHFNFYAIMSKTYKHCLQLFKYFKNEIFSNAILFLPETHSTKENEIKWNNK